MARIRYLKPDFFKDEDIKDLPYEVRLFFAGLWCYADKEGRLEDRPERLKIEIMPYDNKFDVNKALELLEKPKRVSKRPFILRYEINGDKYIQILSWGKHQRPHHTEADSTIPEPPKEVLNSINNGLITVNERLQTAGEGEGNGKGNGKGKYIAPSRKNSSEPFSKITFNFQIKKWENITNEDIEIWKEAYPACDIELELKRMRAWLIDNPQKKKKNYRRFIGSWLSRTQDRGGTKNIKDWKEERDEWVKKKAREIEGKI